jgi:hypothetical protein
MDRAWKANSLKTLIPGLRIVHAEIATTTSGTLASTYNHQYGLKVTKTSAKTGRYTLQPTKSDGTGGNAVAFLNGIVTLVGPDDTAITNSKGIISFFRDDDVGEGANDGTIEVQFVISTATGQADTEVPDGAILCVTMFYKDSNLAA